MFGFGKKEKSLGELIKSPEAPSQPEKTIERTSLEDLKKLGEIRLMDLDQKTKGSREKISGWFSNLKTRVVNFAKRIGRPVAETLKTGATYAAAAPEAGAYALKVSKKAVGETAQNLSGKVSKAMENTGNVNFDNVISMNLNAPTTVRTESGKFESLMARLDDVPEKTAQRLSQVAQAARERIEKVGKYQTLDLHISTQQAQAHQEQDTAKLRAEFDQKVGEIKSEAPNVTHVMEESDYMELARMADRLGTGFKFVGQIGRVPEHKADRYVREEKTEPLEAAA